MSNPNPSPHINPAIADSTSPSRSGEAFALRAAQPGDVPDLVRLIEELAAFEQLSHCVQTTPELIQTHLFGPQPVAQAWVAELPRLGTTPPAVVGFAMCFVNFSTFMARPGLYLEDLYVQPEHRRLGIGQAMLRQLAQIAHARGYGRFEWAVLDWNRDAIRFYERMGATVLPDWRICRVTGQALADLAA